MRAKELAVATAGADAVADLQRFAVSDELDGVSPTDEGAGDNVSFVRDNRLIAVGRMRDAEMSAEASQATVIAAAQAIAQKAG